MIAYYFERCELCRKYYLHLKVAPDTHQGLSNEKTINF